MRDHRVVHGDPERAAGRELARKYAAAALLRTGYLLTRDAGVRDNRGLEARQDVSTFTTPPLTAPMEIVGTPVVELAPELPSRSASSASG